jgi:hypothetical protein
MTMESIVHTPEPWEPVRSLTCGHIRAAHNYNEDPRQEWTDADLRLIAAAPEMLKALKELVTLKDTKPHDYELRKIQAWRAARDAITKATEIFIVAKPIKLESEVPQRGFSPLGEPGDGWS